MVKNQLRLWWIPQLGAKIPCFYAPVNTLPEAKRLYNTLAQYDLFQFENNIKPDYSNAGGLEIFDGQDWIEWEDVNGYQLSDVCLRERPQAKLAESEAEATP